ncbi:hypothetical protein M9Y10_010051 [Tritrichomonas musculus]|uniref:Uncharacterized protein n=1 Tax=Tritrichomonas musculus TaxID=1915356 RepID=A0ABR2IQA1_9EUKA
MNFSVNIQARFNTAIPLLIIFYVISLAYEFPKMKEKSEGDSLLLIKAPFIFSYHIALSFKQKVVTLFAQFGTVGENFNKFIKSVGELFKIFLGQIGELILFLFDFLETILKAPFEIIMNFSQFMEELFRSLSRIIITLYHLLLSILEPIWNQVKKIIPYFLRLLRFPLSSLYQIGLSLYDLAKKISKGVVKTASAFASSLFEILKKLTHISFWKVLNILINPFRWIWDLLMMLYLRFDLFPFFKKLFEILMLLPQYLYNAICDLVHFIYVAICGLIRFIAETLIGMFFDLKKIKDLAKYLPEFLRPIIDILYEIGKYILNLFCKIIVLPYRFAVFLLDLLRHPIQALIDAFHYMVSLIKDFVSVIIRILESKIVQFILGIMKVPLEFLKHLLAKISIKNFLRMFQLPINYIGKALSALAKSIYNAVANVVNLIANGFIYLYALLLNFSFRKLIYYLLTPIRFLIRILEDLMKIPFLGIFARILRIILYIPAWLISFVFRFFFFFLESFINFFSKNFSARNIFDMWDNVCWPRDAEYCKQILAKVQNNNNYNNENYHINDYQFA